MDEWQKKCFWNATIYIWDRQNSNLAGVENQLHQLRHEGVGECEGLQVWVHQSGEQNWQQVPEHGCLGYLFQAFQPEQEKRKIKCYGDVS